MYRSQHGVRQDSVSIDVDYLLEKSFKNDTESVKSENEDIEEHCIKAENIFSTIQHERAQLREDDQFVDLALNLDRTVSDLEGRQIYSESFPSRWQDDNVKRHFNTTKIGFEFDNTIAVDSLKKGPVTPCSLSLF